MRHSGHHRQPDNRQLDVRRPDERTPPGCDTARNGWQRPHGRRALRLIAAIGIITGGLCAVLATMGLVVEFGSRQAGPPRLTIGTTAEIYSGPGAQPPKPIQVPRAGPYGIAWSFSCPPGQAGAFTLEDRSGPAASKTEVTASGSSREGTWWELHARPARSLYVVADCSWCARVVRPATAATATPQPGSGAARKPKHQHTTQEEHGRGKNGHENHGHKQQGHGKHGQDDQGDGNGQ